MWPQTPVDLPICSIETCMHINSLCRSITNQTNLISKKHRQNNMLPGYQRKIAPTIRENLCKQTLIMHILTYKIHQNAHDSPISCSLLQKSTAFPAISFNNQALQSI